MSDDNQQPIVVKRIKKGGGAAHGGAWKIAYADFVTAMMAFFLLMWLLGSTTSGDLKGIADYFNTPLKVALSGGSGSGDSSSIVKGGGEDLTRSYGQKNKSDEDQKKIINLRAAQADRAAVEKAEKEKLAGLKERIEMMINANPRLRQFRNQMLLDLTSEGLRIQIVDNQNRPMFDSASDELKPYTREILFAIGHALNGVENRISLSGHTDATPFAGGKLDYNNWDLSTDRANASRRALIAGGMQEAKVIRLVGLASAVPYDRTDPFSPVNRRISIIVMNTRTEEAILRDGVYEEDFPAPDAGGAGDRAASAGGTPALAPMTR
ncbi:protein that enables flagellar motor rotation [Sterolibacterium denitrificans]|uniref:Flagellar motor protein MotB n=2 Tax=Sterolibacterium denitrificans TaxID=157592 RepID=A0A656Z953_9PROT|nr:flagellar motor protein MotB [Sterolibacterium denitrificans]KYC29338.1 flagellar motor protein MotB [Sterolibacterium denitrificans]SMB30879.1 protein that enables flagellar motor rotation [Sterolibacterium denitrificans]